jgi:hypothetical protein
LDPSVTSIAFHSFSGSLAVPLPLVSIYVGKQSIAPLFIGSFYSLEQIWYCIPEGFIPPGHKNPSRRVMHVNQWTLKKVSLC